VLENPPLLALGEGDSTMAPSLKPSTPGAVLGATPHERHTTTQVRLLNPVSASPWRWRTLARGQLISFSFGRSN